MKIVIIGGTGQLGHFITKHLFIKGHDLVVIGIGNEPEKGFLPEGTKVILKNISLCTEEELLDMFAGADVVVYGAGADGRNLFDKPAINGFRRENVDYISQMLNIMKKVKAKRLIILGSYYTAMHREFPSLNIPSKSPYIQSRVEQIETAFQEAGETISVGVLELPYIFGAAPNRPTLWGFYIDKLKNAISEVPVHTGGSACITMNQVGIAVANACEVVNGKKCYPIGNVNLKYKEIFEIFASQLQLKREIKPMPSDFFMENAKQQKKKVEESGKESAYDPLGLLEFEEYDFFIDPTVSMKELNYDFEDINKAIKESIDATLGKKSIGPGEIN